MFWVLICKVEGSLIWLSDSSTDKACVVWYMIHDTCWCSAWWTFYVRQRTSLSILDSGSPCSSFNIGLMWEYFDVQVTMLAAVLCFFWRFCRDDLDKDKSQRRLFSSLQSDIDWTRVFVSLAVVLWRTCLVRRRWYRLTYTECWLVPAYLGGSHCTPGILCSSFKWNLRLSIGHPCAISIKLAVEITLFCYNSENVCIYSKQYRA